MLNKKNREIFSSKKFMEFSFLSKHRYYYIIFLSIIMLVFNLPTIGIREKIHNIGYSFYDDVTQEISSFFEKIFKRDDNEKYFKLDEKIGILEEKYNVIIFENSLLKEQVKFVNNITFKTITTRITQFSNDGTVIIAAGKQNGVVVGSSVLEGGMLIGKITSVHEKFSTVGLIGSYNIRFAAMIFPSNKRCIIKNNNTEDSLNISYLDDHTNVNSGNLVVTSGDDNATPYGIKIGNIIQKDGNFFVKRSAKAFLQSPFVQVAINSEIPH